MPRGIKTKLKKDSQGMILGYVYRRWVDMPGSLYHGKNYVGYTNDLDARNASFKYHPKSYAGKELTDARAAVPYENWKVETLATFTAPTIQEYKVKGNQLEAQYIALYHSFKDDGGLNSNRGGGGLTGTHLSAARKQQISLQHTGLKHTAQTKAIISQKSKGKTLSPATRNKISAGNKGKKRTAQQRQAQSARQKGIVPVAATAAAKVWQQNNPGGWWGNHPVSQETKDKIKDIQQARGTKVKATFDDGSIICYPTMKDAGAAFGLGAGSISNFIKTKNRSEKAKAKFEVITKAQYDAWLAAQHP